MNKITKININYIKINLGKLSPVIFVIFMKSQNLKEIKICSFNKSWILKLIFKKIIIHNLNKFLNINNQQQKTPINFNKIKEEFYKI